MRPARFPGADVLHARGKGTKEEISMKVRYTALAFAAAALVAGQAAWAGEAEAKKWIDSEFQPSTLNKDQQMAEMKWFIEAAKKLQAKMQSGKSIYDGWINDSDHIGTHYRYGTAYALSDQMAGAWKEYTNPGLDLKDFIGTSFTTAPDGKLYQLPDQQFANLYWFRADLFARPDLKDKFKAKYGYDLGVPLNWSAYEDIAEFFTNDVKTVDGHPIYGHMDYGK